MALDCATRQAGPIRKLAPKATPTQDDKLRVDQTPPGALKRKLSEGAGPSGRGLEPASSPEAAPTPPEVGPSGEEANSPTTSGRGQRQTRISPSNLVQGENSAERSMDQDWLFEWDDSQMPDF